MPPQSLSKSDRGDLLILGLLQSRPHHGYELKRLLGRSLAGIGRPVAATVYYSLKRLHRAGKITTDSPLGPTGQFPPRCIWKLTTTGRGSLETLCHNALNDLTCPAPLTFGVLLAEERSAEELRRLLQQRRACLLHESQVLSRDSQDQADQCLTALYQLCQQQLGLELGWIDGLLQHPAIHTPTVQGPEPKSGSTNWLEAFAPLSLADTMKASDSLLP